MACHACEWLDYDLWHIIILPTTYLFKLWRKAYVPSRFVYMPYQGSFLKWYIHIEPLRLLKRPRLIKECEYINYFLTPYTTQYNIFFSLDWEAYGKPIPPLVFPVIGTSPLVASKLRAEIRCYHGTPPELRNLLREV